MERKTKIMILILVAIVIGLSGLLTWQVMERAKWERAFSQLNGAFIHEFIMNNPDVLISSIRMHLEEGAADRHGYRVPRPPKEMEAKIEIRRNVGEKIFDISF